MIYVFMIIYVCAYYRYINTKIGTFADSIYTNFHGLNVPEDGVEW